MPEETVQPTFTAPEAPAQGAPVRKYVAPPGLYSFDAPRPGAERTTLTTAIVDSIAADTVAGRVPHFATAQYADSVAVDILAAEVSQGTPAVFVPSGGSVGLPPRSLTAFPAGGSALAALLMGTLVVTALCGPSVGRALRTYRNNLLTVRRRNNAFDGIGRVPVPVATLIALVFIVFGGTCLYLGLGSPVAPSFAAAATVMSVLGAYYILQLIVYNLIGYAFTSPDGRRQWVEGFNASQAFGGLLLTVPALLLLTMPQWRPALAAAAAAIYIASRIVFVCKGFRIFYRGFRSLLYFVLYIACLEIIPPAAILMLVRYLILYNR